MTYRKERNARLFVDDSTIMKLDETANKAQDMTTFLPGAKIEDVTERDDNVIGSARKRVLLCMMTLIMHSGIHFGYRG